jgi:hypothetical protein
MTKGTPALVAQLDLIEWFRGDLARGWGEFMMRGTPGVEFVGRSTDALALEVSRQMNTAETVFISRDMCTLIEAAAETLPDIPIQEENLFWPSAFIYFERPIRHAAPMVNVDDVVVETSAIFYAPTSVMDSVTANAVAVEEGAGETYLDLPVERYSEFAHKGLTHVTFIKVAQVAQELGIESASLGTRFFPFDQSGWIYGKSWETVEKKTGTSDVSTEIEIGLSQQRKLLLATLLIAQQYIAVRSTQRAKRQVRRRMERMDTKPEFGDIVYVTLRRNSASVEEGEEGEGFEYSHRFMVKGYWKHQWYPSKGEHHLIWIDPYIKGPKHKPLIIKDKVYKLVR